MALTGDLADHVNVIKFGFKSGVTLGDQAIWTGSGNGPYTFPGSAVALTATSDVHSIDVGGVSSLGTGARAVKISGLDTNWNLIDEVLVMDGSSGTNVTSNEFLRVNRVQVVSSGLGEKNGGNIYVGVGALTAGFPVTLISRIDSGHGQTQQAIYSSPASYDLELHSFEASTGKGGTIEVKLWATEAGNGRNIKIREEITNDSIRKAWHHGRIFPPKTDLEVTGSLVSGSAADVAATMDMDLHLIGTRSEGT